MSGAAEGLLLWLWLRWRVTIRFVSCRHAQALNVIAKEKVAVREC